MSTRLPLIDSGNPGRALPVGPKESRRRLTHPAIFVIHSQGDMSAARVAQQIARDAGKAGIRACAVVSEGVGPRAMLDDSCVMITSVKSGVWEQELSADLDIIVAAGHAFPGWLEPDLTLLIAPTPNPASWDEGTRRVRDRYDLLVTEYRPRFLGAWLKRWAARASTKP